MSDQIITIKSVSQKISKAGKPFWSVEAEEGKFSVWDADVGKKITLNEGNTVEVAVLMNGKYSNIVEFNKVVEKAKTQSQSNGYNPITMLISYAKDLTVAEINNLVSFAKDLKEAREIVSDCEKAMYTKIKGMKNLMENVDADEDNQEGDDAEEDYEADS